MKELIEDLIDSARECFVIGFGIASGICGFVFVVMGIAGLVIAICR